MRVKNLFAGAVALVLFASSPVMGGGWKPQGPIKLIIAFSAGGGTDTQARLIASDIETATGWKIIPQQVTGKGGVNALMALKKEPADGTVIAMVVTESLGYNAIASNSGLTPANFTGLSTTAGFQMAVVANANKGWKTFDDMIAAAKKDNLRFAASGARMADFAYLIAKAQDVTFNIVEVKGGKKVMNGVLAGDYDLGFMAGIQAKGVAAGDLVELASGLSVPLKATPSAPRLMDRGVPFDAGGYFVLVGPDGMNPEARKAIAAAIADSVKNGKASEFINNAFGGATVIQGADLDSTLQNYYDSAKKLMESVK